MSARPNWGCGDDLALLSLLLGWWSTPIARATSLATGRTGGSVNASRLAPALFGASGIAPIGYALFAFALGVAAGVLIRRTVPAMAVTLAGFAAVQIVVPLWIRPHLMTPLTAIAPLDTATISGLRFDGPRLTVFPGVTLPDAWVLSNRATTASGQVYAGPTPKGCLDFASFQQCRAALASSVSARSRSTSRLAGTGISSGSRPEHSSRSR